MMGRDCERLLLILTNTKDMLEKKIESLSKLVSVPIEMEEYHIEGDYVNESFILKEKELELDLSDIISGVGENIGTDMIESVGKVSKLNSDLYVSVTEFNNSYGSPWTEFDKFKKVMEELGELSINEMKCTSEVIAMIAKMNIAISCIVDAKWALITYHDYIQRGFDKIHNAKKPSVLFKRTKTQTSIGNINQKFDENVNVEEETIDPF